MDLDVHNPFTIRPDMGDQPGLHDNEDETYGEDDLTYMNLDFEADPPHSHLEEGVTDLRGGGEEDLSYLTLVGRRMTHDIDPRLFSVNESTSLDLELDDDYEYEDFVERRPLRNVSLVRHTNRHVFACSWSMILFTTFPLLVLILDSVYLAHLVWLTLAENVIPQEHSYWRLELCFIIVQNVIGLSVILFMLFVTVSGKRISFNVVFTSLFALVLIGTGSSFWSYKESSHTHFWFPTDLTEVGTTLPQYVKGSNWFTPMRFVQLKLIEIAAIFVMLWIWIWNWEQILELHGERDDPPTPESVEPPTTEFLNPGSSSPNTRGLFSLKVPRITTDQEPEPPSSSATRTDADSVVDRNLNGTKPTTELGSGGEDMKNEVEFREDGDRHGLAQPSRILGMGF